MTRLEEARAHAAQALEALLLANHHQLDEVCRALAASGAAPGDGHRKRLRAWIEQIDAVVRELRAAKESVERVLAD